jgi:hypothetical protein
MTTTLLLFHSKLIKNVEKNESKTSKKLNQKRRKNSIKDVEKNDEFSRQGIRQFDKRETSEENWCKNM